MEGVLKDLEGKKLTKKKLFDILAGLNLEELLGRSATAQPLPEQPKEVEEVEEVKKEKFLCTACVNTFATKSSLTRHHRRHPACVSWIAKSNEPANKVKLDKGLHLVLGDILLQATSKGGNYVCKFCCSSFSTKGNLYKHLGVMMVCNQLAYDEFKRLFLEL